MKRLLCIVGGMNAGGAETFLMKMYRALDKSKYQMDFAVASDGIYDEEITQYGGKIYKITPKSSGAIKNFLSVLGIVKNNHYKAVLRVSQNSLSALELFAAELGGAEIRGYRSSNSNTVSGTKKEIIIHKLCMWMTRLFANVRFAPSTEAAEYMFGKGCIDSGDAFLLKNGLALDVYKYSEDARKEVRTELGLRDEFVVGHIGRFNQQKNHAFLLDVFAEIKKIHGDAVLLLCGKGEKESEVRNRVEKMGLSNSVMFLGVRSDIPRLLSAMDIFVFPSLYEGMPNTVIEAQANGLPCYISNHITKEARVTDLVTFLPLQNPEHWQKTIQMTARQKERSRYNLEMYQGGYDIDSCTRLFVEKMFL